MKEIDLSELNIDQSNKLILGDNLEIMKSLPSESIDLIYADPPFFSQRDYKEFTDVWEGMGTYLAWMNARLFEMRRLLKSTGSMFVHLDWHAAHYLKIEMDKIFGYENFINEIVWQYKTGGMSKKWLGRKHDNILFYCKEPSSHRFYIQKEKSYLSHKYGFKNVEILEDENGYYTMVCMRDTWDIPALRGNQSEVIGYPTQKPEELLKRIINISTISGDIVADFFCGGGTTTIVAQKHGRKWIGSDISKTAIDITYKRIKKIVEES